MAGSRKLPERFSSCRKIPRNFRLKHKLFPFQNFEKSTDKLIHFLPRYNENSNKMNLTQFFTITKQNNAFHYFQIVRSPTSLT